MYYPDLSNECQVAAGPTIRAVGWLSAESPFPTASTPIDVVARLKELVKTAFQPVVTGGWHEWIDIGRGVLDDAGRTAGEDYRLGCKALDQACVDAVTGVNFAVDAGFTDPPRNQLGDLRAEIDDQNLIGNRKFGCHGA